MAKQKKQLEKALKRAGSFITGQEALKISQKFDIPELQIAQRAAERLSDKGKTANFSRALAQRLQKQAQQNLPPDRVAMGGHMGSGSTLAMLAAARQLGQFQQLGVSEEFARNLANTPRFDKSQMLTIGKRGAGSVMPLDRNQGGGGRKRDRNRGEENTAPGYDYAGELAAMGGLGGLGNGGMTINLGSDSDADYLKQIQQQQNEISRSLTSAIEQLSTPIQPAPPAPTVVYGAGDNYNVEGVRAASRRPRRRSDYIRNSMSIQPQISASLIGSNVGGITI